MPWSARAQFTVTDPVADATGLWTKITAIGKDLKVNIGQAAGRALMKSFRNFVNKMSRDTAIWLASGNYDKGPMWYTDAAGYFENAGLQAAADAIGYFGDETQFLQKYGINLCNPGIPAYNLGIKLKMYNTLDPQPRCNWREIQNAYSNLGTAGAWSQVGMSFQPGQNGLSLSLETLEALDKIRAEDEQKARDKADSDGSMKNTASPVGGDATAPVAVNEEQAKSVISDSKTQKTEEVKATKDDLNLGNIAGVLGDAAAMFTNTLSDQLAEQLRKKGLLSVGQLITGIACGVKDGSWTCKKSAPNDEQAQVVGNREASEATFADFVKPTFGEIGDYQYVATELTPDCATNNGPYCGALDSDFQEILSLAQAGTPLTVGEALNFSSGKLHGDWELLPKGSCKPNAYCYDNLIKLRFFRILSLGWEIAAQKAVSLGQKVFLKDVVAGFYDSSSQYYHLIDPNWLIVAPKARCSAEVNSSLALYPPTADTPGQRAKSCTDVQSCVGENSQTGQCNFWGYCLREKNFWQLGADSCDEQFNTCTGYASSQGQAMSFLANTIDRGICTADNSGCRSYAISAAYLGGDWNWQSGAGDPKIYFNRSVERCGNENEGCSKFIREAEGVVGENLNLKKAPEFYNCYGENLVPTGTPNTNTLSSSTLAWPVNKSDLYKISNGLTAEQKIQCSRFATVCSAEEKSCELYTPSNGNPTIPGVLTTGDLCPNECVGYETYIEQPITQFSGNANAYFIPANAKSCKLENVGCEEFVNIETQAAGGEQKAYFSQIKSCSKIAAEGDTFYTWEGSDTSGYQLKTYILKKDTRSGHTGEPAYNTGDALTLTFYENICSASTYADKITLGKDFDPDCREFYNRQGEKSYRLYSKTVTVSPSECKNYRKSLSDQISCDATGGAWDSARGICIHSFISLEAKSCPATAVGCRAYKGNAGNNFQTIYFQDFETGTVGSTVSSLDWTGTTATISSEATVVGGKSLKVIGASGFTNILEKNKTISISFWAKSQDASLNLAVQFGTSLAGSNFVSQENRGFNLTNNWAVFTADFNVSWDQEVSSSTLQFGGQGNIFYLDNVVVKQMTDNVYVIKDSWATPSSCDNVNGDPFGSSLGGNSANPLRLAPQAQLGCESYSNRKGDTVAVKFFSSICREEAVGCEELVETFDTETTSATLFNAKCSLLSSPQTYSNQVIDCKDKNGEHKCDVLPGQTFCRFNYVGLGKNLTELGPELHNLNSVAATTDAEGHSYGVNLSSDSESILVPTDRMVYLVNSPAFQCSSDNAGCRALGLIDYSANGAVQASTTVYLKDQPDNYGKILCSQEAEGCNQYTTDQGGSDYFKDPTVFGNRLCEWKDKINGSTGGWVIKGTTDSCYAGTNYKIFKNGDATYNGAVGLCPAAQNGCSEFVDPVGAGTASGNLSGQSYYVINNEKIDRGSCGGSASLQQGCVLFNETAKGDRLWNADATYNLSQQNNYQKVNPIDCGVEGEKTSADNLNCTNDNLDANDANVILKVKRDRVCGEWLACASTMKVLKNGNSVDICTELKNCDKIASAAEVNNSDELLGQCGHWVEDTNKTPAIGQILDLSAYVSANNGAFSVKDFSGYSIYNGRQIADLVASNGLKAINNQPVYNGGGPIAESCRGFASAEIPSEANSSRLNPSLYPDFCSFAKVEYGGSDKAAITKYYLANQLLENKGVCDGGFLENGQSKKSLPCVDVSDCSDDRPANQKPGGITLGASCLTDRKISREFGWNGYCLLKDSTDKCVMWYPLAVPKGGVDLYALNREAGYYPPEGSGKFWCVQAKGNASLPFQDNGDTFGYGSSYKLITRAEPKNTWETSGRGRCFSSNGTEISNINTEEECKNSKSWVPFTADLWKEQTFFLTSVEKDLNFSEVVAMGLTPLSFINGKDYPANELLTFTKQKLNGVSNGDGYYWSGTKLENNGDISLEFFWHNGPDNRTEGSFNFLTQSKCENFYDNTDSNAIAFRVTFDKTTGKLKSMNSKTCDGSTQSGGFKAELDFYLTEVCTDIRQVVQDNPVNPDVQSSVFGFKAKARTDRIWQEGRYILGGDDNGKEMKLPFNQFFTPFGSFDQSQDPKDLTLIDNSKTNWDKLQSWYVAGYWPIWLKSGGATPLNCSPDNGGDCGKAALCSAGPNVNQPCNMADNKNEGNLACNEQVDDGTCKPSASLDKKVCAGETDSGKNLLQMIEPAIDCSNFDSAWCLDRVSSHGFAECIAGVCYGTPLSSLYKWSCSEDGDCIPDNVSCQNISGTCQGGSKNGSYCSVDDDCQGGVVKYLCDDANQIRGLCVGGLNHGLMCGSSKDCPPKTYGDTVGMEVVEQGTCVGISLEQGKTIPQTIGDSGPSTPNIGDHSQPNAAFLRLQELFASSFNTWAWNENKYELLGSGWSNRDKSQGDSGATQTINNLSAAITPHPPKIYSLNPAGNNSFTWGTVNMFSLNFNNGYVDNQDITYNGSSPVVTAAFYAYADNDQMPITRVAIDWGDGSVYESRGWYKNHKPVCESSDEKVCDSNLNKPCNSNADCGSGISCSSPSSPNDRLHFGNSAEACEEGYFTYKHVYECLANNGLSLPVCSANVITNCWDNINSQCHFKPKVQVLDNWGWCNGTCAVVIGGCWDDPAKEDDFRACSIDNKSVIEHWTSFSNKVIITP